MIVADDDGEVVGLRLAVAVPRPAGLQRHRRGLGLRPVATSGAGASGAPLLAELVELAAQHGFHTVIARIVGGHEASIGLHRAAGFAEVGIEREVGRKFGTLARRRRHATHA